MKPQLTTFFQHYPMQGDMKLALKMIKEELKHAIKDLEEKEGDEYLSHLSKVHKMVEAIFVEIGKHPDQY